MYNPYNWTIVSKKTHENGILSKHYKEMEEKRLSKEWSKKMAELSIAKMKCEILEEECKELREKIRNLYI